MSNQQFDLRIAAIGAAVAHFGLAWTTPPIKTEPWTSTKTKTKTTSKGKARSGGKGSKIKPIMKARTFPLGHIEKDQLGRSHMVVERRMFGDKTCLAWKLIDPCIEDMIRMLGKMEWVYRSSGVEASTITEDGAEHQDGAKSDDETNDLEMIVVEIDGIEYLHNPESDQLYDYQCYQETEDLACVGSYNEELDEAIFIVGAGGKQSDDHVDLAPDQSTSTQCSGCIDLELGRGGENQEAHYGGCLPAPWEDAGAWPE